MRETSVRDARDRAHFVDAYCVDPFLGEERECADAPAIFDQAIRHA
jgi:hypothetical protein